jgi:hypothetical protein
MLLHLLQIFTWLPKPVRVGEGMENFKGKLRLQPKILGALGIEQIVVFVGEVSTQQSYRDR